MIEINWDEKKVLITGATGLIGSWMVKELLELGCHIVALVRDVDYQSELYRSKDHLKITIMNGKLEEFSDLIRAINEHKIDTIFHLGAQTIVGAALYDPLQTFESNIRGTYHVLEASRRYKDFVENVIIASSDKAYGTSEILPYIEDMALKGMHPYDVSKSCTDLLAQTYHNTYNLPVVIARCGNVYGGGDLNWSRIVPGTIRSLLYNERPVIRSSGKFIRDYIYVKDIAKAYLFLAEKNSEKQIAGEAFNFSNEKPITIIEIVDEIRKLMRKENIEPKILNLELKEIFKQYLSSKKANKILGWLPKYDLKEGLTETIEWYEEFLGVNK